MSPIATDVEHGDFKEKKEEAATSSDPVLLTVTHKSPLLEPDIDEESKSTSTALVILNAPIRMSPLFRELWRISDYRVCADGGANRLYRATVTTATTAAAAAVSGVAPSYYVPDLIRGDLDSLRSEVREYYEARGATIERVPDQDANDLDKALSAVRTRRTDPQQRQQTHQRQRVVVYGAFGGRFDQEMASLQALYKWSTEFSPGGLWLYNDYTCACLLREGVTNRIQLHIPPSSALPADGQKEEPARIGEGPTCGLIPLGRRADSVTTTGFEWNLNRDATEFGGLVSTSNRILQDATTATNAVVVSSHPLVFTAQVHAGLLDDGHDNWD